MRRLKVLLIGIMLYSVVLLAASPASKIDQTQNSYSSQGFTSLADTAEIQTQAGNHKEALEVYKKAYRVRLMKDIEEQMVWLRSKFGDQDEFAGELAADINYNNRVEMVTWRIHEAF